MCMFVCLRVLVCVCVHVHVCACVCVSIYVRMFWYIFMRVDVHVCAYQRVCIRIEEFMCSVQVCSKENQIWKGDPQFLDVIPAQLY